MRTYILDLEDSWDLVDVPIDSGVVLGSVLPPEGVREYRVVFLGATYSTFLPTQYMMASMRLMSAHGTTSC